MCSGGIQLLSQSHPRLLPIALATSSSYRPSLLLPVIDQGSLCINNAGANQGLDKNILVDF